MASFIKEWDIQYAPHDDKDTTRTIGVESEVLFNDEDSLFYGDNMSSALQILKEKDEELYEEMRNAPLGVASEFAHVYMEGIGAECGGYGYDGADKELVTEPDSMTLMRSGGSERFQNFYRYLSKHATTSESSGTHIHISQLPGEDEYEVYKNILYLTSVFASQLSRVFGRVTHWARPAVWSYYYDDPHEDYNDSSPDELYNNGVIVKLPMPDIDDLSRTSLDDKGTMVVLRSHTYEFRAPKSSVDIEEVLAWIEVCHNIVELSARHSAGSISDVQFGQILQGLYIYSYMDKVATQARNRSISDFEMSLRGGDIRTITLNLANSLVF